MTAREEARKAITCSLIGFGILALLVWDHLTAGIGCLLIAIWAELHHANNCQIVKTKREEDELKQSVTTLLHLGIIDPDEADRLLRRFKS